MSIKPVDFNVMLPKAQELSISKHNENVKNQNVVQSEFINQNKKISNQQNRVKDKEKVDSTKIKKEEKFKKNTKEEERENHKSESKDAKDKNDKTKNKDLGSNIDIRI